MLCREHLHDVRSEVVLLSSELVAHALFSGTLPSTLSIDCHVSRVELRLHAVGTPLERPGFTPRLGAFLIDQLASGWGTQDHGDTRTYWCVLGAGVPAAVPQSF